MSSNLHSDEKEVIGYDFEQVLLVLAQQHQPKGRIVDCESKETFAVGPAGETMVAWLRWGKREMSIL